MLSASISRPESTASDTESFLSLLGLFTLSFLELFLFVGESEGLVVTLPSLFTGSIVPVGFGGSCGFPVT